MDDRLPGIWYTVCKRARESGKPEVFRTRGRMKDKGS